MTKLTGVVSLIVLLITFNLGILSAQEQEAIYSGNFVVNLRWSEDSQFLTFKDGIAPYGLRTEEPVWKIFKMAEQELSEQNVYPFLPPIGHEQLVDLEFNYIGNNNDVLYFVSSDDHYVVYQGTPVQLGNGRTTFPKLTIADLQSGNYQKTEMDMVAGPGATPDIFNVIWAPDNRSFIVNSKRSGGDDIFNYFYNYSENVGDFSYELIDRPLIQGQEYDVVDITSISDDEMLLVIGETRTDDRETRVIIYDAQNVDESLVFDLGDVIGAHFNRAEENEILFINEDGLSVLNYLTNEIRVLNSEVNTSWADEALFSPDSTHVAVVDVLPENIGIEQVELYVYEINP